ncbi:hypothetical protein BRC82_00185 [Halobacteriales archaeon QS_1_67_19]|nr:MAG: hypothetical protein BRC82_00185 [Halobacteriales archaeon QS_1_67_19]
MTARQTLALPDGRTLTYATYGDDDGAPLVFHHGTPGLRVLDELLSDAARERGVRVIAPDRPGFGGEIPIRMWHGTDDGNVPLDPVRAAWRCRPEATLSEVETDHLGSLLAVRNAMVDLAN